MKFKADNLAEAPERLGFEEVESPQKNPQKMQINILCIFI